MKGFFASIGAKIAGLLKPLWKGAAKKILAYECSDLRLRAKAMIDEDTDGSIVRVNRVFDGWQNAIINGLNKVPFLPKSMAASLAEKVNEEGDRIQENIVNAIKERGALAVDAAFDGIEAKLNNIIDMA
jgi:hypothetical protein